MVLRRGNQSVERSCDSPPTPSGQDESQGIGLQEAEPPNQTDLSFKLRQLPFYMILDKSLALSGPQLQLSQIAITFETFN